MSLFPRFKFSRAVVALLSTTLLATSISVVGQSPAQAVTPTCSAATVAVTALHGPVFYADSSNAATQNSQYAGYKLTNSTGTALNDIWIGLSGFTGATSTVIKLASKENANHKVGTLNASGGTGVAFYYLTDTSPSTNILSGVNNQSHVVTIYQGDPNVGGTAICTQNDIYTKVYTSTISASANKITSLTVSGTPSLGGTFTITQVGDTGTIGAGLTEDPGVIELSPATDPNWPANSFQLISNTLTIGGTTYSNILRLSNASASQGAYTTVSTFKVIGGTSAATNLSPLAYIASGTQTKYTGTTSTGSIAAATGDEYITISQTNSPLTYPGGNIVYKIQPSGTAGIAINSFSVTIPTGASYVAGTAKWAGSAITGPSLSGNVLTFTGQNNFTVGTDALEFTLAYGAAAGVGTKTVSATATSGSITLGNAIHVSTPTTVDILINKATLTITALSKTVTAGSAVPTITATYSGLLNGDSSSVVSGQTCTTTYTTGTLATDPTPTTSCSGGTASNYNINYVGGTITVVAGAITPWNITFDYNNTPGSPSTTSVQAVAPGDDALLVAPVPTWTGHNLVGWSTTKSPADSGTALSTYPASADATLYAVWTINSYTINFLANGGTGGASVSVKYGVDAFLSKPTPTYSGYTFQGWSQTSNGVAPYDTSYTVTGNKDFYAIWQAVVVGSFVVTYDANSGTGGTTQSLPSGTDAIPYAPTVTYTGYTFGGWSLSGSTPSLSSYTVTGTVTLKAIWTPINYSIVFDPNGGSGGGTVSVPFGTNALPSAPGVYNPGYSFGGWSLSGSGSALGSYTVSGPATLKAIWTLIIYPVTYNANGGTGGTTQNEGYGSNAVALAPTVQRPGYTFGGWSLTGNAPSTGSVTVYGPTTLVAIWIVKPVDINFDGNGNNGGNPPAPTSCILGSSGITLPGAGTLTREGYTFGGWTIDDVTVLASPYCPQSAVTLKALWIPKTYTFTYNGNGNTDGNAPGATKCVYGSGPYSLAGLGTLSKKGFIFVGWGSSPTGPLVTSPVAQCSDLNLYALWEAVTPQNDVVIPGGQDSKIPLTDLPPSSNIQISNLCPGLDQATLDGQSVGYTPNASFSGKTCVTVKITINGQSHEEQVPVTVLPVAPANSVSGPTTFGSGVITWNASPNAVRYEVWIRGVKVCDTTSTTCSVLQTVGPDTPVQIIAFGGDDTQVKVTPIYSIKKPLPALVVNFATAKFDLSASAVKEIARVAAIVKREGFTRLVITGHTDNQQGIDNKKLSANRARVTKEALEKLLPGVSVEVAAYADTKPVKTNATNAGKASNRRAEVAVW